MIIYLLLYPFSGTKREQSVIDTSETFQNLMPYSDYNLYVYAKTAEGHYNPKLPFKIPAKTKFANKAGPPRDLTAKITNDGSNSIHITWKPPYPPTGISAFKIYNQFTLNTVFSGAVYK